MVFSSQEETHDSNTPLNTSIRTATYQGSISNFNGHTASTVHDEDLFGPSGHSPDRDFPIPYHKSSYSLQKPTFGLRNQSLSTVGTTCEPESGRSSIETSTPKQEPRSLSLPSCENEAVSSLPSTLLSSAYTPVTDPSPSLRSNYGVTLSTPIDDLLPKPYGDSQPSATMEISMADKAPIRPPPFLLRPTDRIGTTSRSRSSTATVKGKKGALGFMSDFRNSNKRPEITTPHDLVHLAHVDFNSSTGEFTGFPNEWQQLLQDSGISKSDQEKNPLAVMEIVKIYQESGGNVLDKMRLVPAQGSSRRPPIPGAENAVYPEAPVSVNAATRESPNSSNTDVGQASKASSGPVVEPRDHQLLTGPQQQSTAVTSSAKTAGAIPRRREKKEGKANNADIVKRLQQICTDADPTRLYRNLVKIGQG
jgi:p21-activated kinase 1